MNTIVMTKGQGITNQLPKLLQKYQIPSKQAYVQFAAKYKDVMIQVYSSGKIVFQGTQAEVIAQEFGYQSQELHQSNNPLTFDSMIGTDEVGNGSYFGSLVVVASYITSRERDLLLQLGVTDSKHLSDQKILEIAPLLKQKIPHKALLLTPKKYNELVGPGKDYNAVSIKVALHNQAIFLLLQEGFQPDQIIIDAFTSIGNYQKYVKTEKNLVKQAVHLETKAEDKYLAVAVSSIIARQLFLENLVQLGKTIGQILPSGAGNKSDQIASHILAKQGMTGLSTVAKLHFANTTKAFALLKNKGL